MIPIRISSAILFAFFTLVVNCMVTPLNAQEIGFLEDYVLAENREAALKQLVPGTEPYYYYHALHYQNSRQLDKVDALMDPWKKRFGESELYRQIRNRQTMLIYPQTPAVSLDYIKRELNLNFNHQRQIPQAQRNLESAFDESKISQESLLQNALSRSGLEKITDQGLKLLEGANLNKTQRRELLGRLRRPDFKGLVDLVDTELQEKDAQPFGSVKIHQQMTLSQLDELAAKRPRIKTESAYVNVYLSKLVPSNDVDWVSNREERRKYLERLQQFVTDLAPTFNSLKANIAYQLLQLDIQEDKYDRNRFLEYIKLPRNLYYVNPEFIKSFRAQNQFVQLNQDYTQQILLPPIGSDDELVKAYLSHFLRDADDYRDFEPYIRDTFLKVQFAETKILAGIGDVEKWASMLDPERYKELLQRIDLDFATTNPRYLADNDEVKLDLYIKNVDNLTVKIFEINTENYYRRNSKEIDTDIDLDGLVPNFEKTFQYDSAPALRQRRSFAFPELKDRGVYVIDFIAGGKSSRALIRKGRLELIESVNAAGHSFVVIDNFTAKPVPNASLWISGKRYQPEKDGSIQVPFSTQPGRTNVIVTDGNYSSLHDFQHLAEVYQFKAALVLDRENLSRGNKAKILIRPSLAVAGATEAPLGLLTEPKLQIASVNLDGISANQTLADFKFSDEGETICEFMVPPRTKSISLTLTTKIKNFSRDADETLSASETFEINAIDQSDEIQDFHLVPTSAGYFIEALGKSGETRPNQAVRVKLKVNGFADDVYADLQSDDQGRIQLGRLMNVNSVSIEPSVGRPRSWNLETQDQTYHQSVHIAVGEAIEIPAPAGVTEADAKYLSLLELRAGRVVGDQFSSLSVKNGMIRVEGLEAGDYSLMIGSPLVSVGNRFQHNVSIRVSGGVNSGGVMVGPARHLELGNREAIQISTIAGNKDKVRIELENVSASTRVHVVASRYQPAFDTFGGFAAVNFIEPWMRKPADRRSVYQQGRTIGDEYEYILRRKYAAKFPGNMLERPSLLLNPWSPRETQNDAQDAADGDEFAMAGNGKSGARGSAKGKRIAAAGNNDFSNLDFAGDGSVVLANLKPNKAGVVSIDRAALGPNQHVRVIAVDGSDTIQRNINFELTPLVPRDARLVDALDPNQHFSQSKQTELLAKGSTVKIDDLVSAKFQQYDELADVYTLLQTLNNDPKLNQFRFVLEWKNKTQEEKQELYSEFVCHELNYFLFQKDPEFFKDVVLPHLKNKRVKTFMDQYLLRENLESYTRPWQFARLNTFEKILLAQRLEARAADLARTLTDDYSLSPTSRQEMDRLYDTTLSALGLDSTREQILAETRKSLEKKKGESRFESLGRVAPQSATMVRPKASPGGLAGDGFGAGGLGGGGGFGGRESSVYSVQADAVELDAVSNGLDVMVLNGQQVEGKAQAFDRRYALEIEVLDESQKLDEFQKLDDSENGNFGGVVVDKLGVLRERQARLYRRIAATQEWIENNYYKITPDQQSPELVRMNQFWRDYVNHQGGAFLSPHFAEANHSFTSAMFALSVLDLPLTAADNELKFADNSMTFTAGGPAIVLHQQVRAAKFERGDTKVLVSENFFQKNDRYRYEDNIQFDKFISGEFLAHTLYGSQVVITNPTSTPRQVELLVQIPEGSVACSGSQETRTTLLLLGPFTTQTFEYSFYFPTDGKFKHYPAHVSADEQVLAVADGVEFNVVDRQAKLDESSWEFVSQNGTNDQVIDFINNHNVKRIDLSKIAFRMKDKAFFVDAMGALRNRYIYDPTLWAYGIMHDDVDTIREFMTHDNAITNNCGIEFECELLKLDPTERNWYGHKEYWPLVNARAHQLGAQRKILNNGFHAQYQNLLSVLAQHQELSDDDHLVITYYLLLQDRVEAALEHFAKVSENRVNSVMQYHYCDAYLDFYRGNPEAAASKAAVYADYPVDRWRNRFQAILAQVEEIKGGQTIAIDEKDNLQKQTELAAASESIDLEVINGTIQLRHQNVENVKVNFYEMDIELLFSRSPFAQDDLDGFSVIRPNQTQSVKLKSDDKGRGTFDVKLPESMKNKNVLVEVVAGDQVRSQPFFAHSLDVKLQENYGQLQVTEQKSGRAIAKTYVKVYARMADGTVRFHKDGYTDLRGRFDYVTQSNRSPDGIEKLSILILSDEQGAVTRQAEMPKE